MEVTFSVTTCVVVWIEIILLMALFVLLIVTTCVVVWIEIWVRWELELKNESPPAWWCGLKYSAFCVMVTRAWGHHLRGGVD